MKLLIVDDNSAMRTMIRSIVAKADDSVLECGDGSDVVRMFGQIHPDVVLMDLQMPKMNGINATRVLKKEFPDARVIIVSNFNDHEFREEARDAGAVSYFSKDDLMQLRHYIHQ